MLWPTTCQYKAVKDDVFRKGFMSLRKILDREILIRLTESGFVETVRCFGLKRTLSWETTESEPAEETMTGERLMFARVRPRRNQH